MNRSIYLILFAGTVAAGLFWFKTRKVETKAVPEVDGIVAPRQPEAAPYQEPAPTGPGNQSSGPLGGHVQPQGQNPGIPSAGPLPAPFTPEQPPQPDMLPPPAPPEQSPGVPPPDAYYPPPAPAPNGDEFEGAPPPPPPPPPPPNADFEGEGFAPDEDFQSPPPAPIEEDN